MAALRTTRTDIAQKSRITHKFLLFYTTLNLLKNASIELIYIAEWLHLFPKYAAERSSNSPNETFMQWHFCFI
jgi:hypothetical protein